MMETNTILSVFFMLVALTFLVVIIMDRKKFIDHSGKSQNYTNALFGFSISTTIGIFLLGAMQNIGPVGLWILVLGLNATIAVLVLDKPKPMAESAGLDERERLRDIT